MKIFLALAVSAGLAALAFAGTPQSADEGFCIKYIPALTSAAAVQITPVYIAAPACSNPSKVKSVCVFNQATSALSKSFIAESNTVDDNAGWPVMGHMDRCYDVGPNFKSWVFRAGGEPDAGLKVMYLK